MQRNLLICAYGCEPGKGSEQGVGWNWVLQIAQTTQVTVITRANNQDAIEAACPDTLKDQITFEYYDVPKALRWIKSQEKRLYPYYLLWQIGVYFKARRLIRHTSFDATMALTFGSIWMPTFLHMLPLPFIWGPIGGGEAVPRALLNAMPRKSQILQRVRYGLFKAIPLHPLIMSPLKRACIILVRTQDTAGLIPSRYQSKTQIVLETAIAPEVCDHFEKLPVKDQTDQPLQAIYTGRLIGLKNVSSAIAAVAKAIAQGRAIDFTIIGSGPETDRLKALAAKLGVQDHVHFKGKQPLSNVLDALAQSDVYLFPSLKEGGVWSLMEAMAARLPVICMKTSGMEIITDDTCAFRIPPTQVDETIEGMAQALVTLADHPDQCAAMGKAARTRIIEDFQWAEKGVVMTDILSRIDSECPITEPVS